MTKGTSSHGKKTGKINHYSCRRCGKNAYHKTKKVCASCGFGRSAKLRTFAWQR